MRLILLDKFVTSMLTLQFGYNTTRPTSNFQFCHGAMVFVSFPLRVLKRISPTMHLILLCTHIRGTMKAKIITKSYKSI